MIKKLSLYTIAFLATIVIFSSCKKDDQTVQQIDATKLTAYFAKNNIKATPDSANTGYYYVLNQPVGSTAATYKGSDSVRYSINLTGLSTGTVYTTTPSLRNEGQRVGSTFGFYGKAIPAISSVLQKLQPGGSTQIYLPSNLAFGKNGFPTAGIPSNEVMVVTVTTYKESQKALDEAHIKSYLTANSIVAVRADSGIYVQTITAGTGPEVIDQYSLVNFTYTLKTFDNSINESSTLISSPKSLIPGFKIIMPKFSKGTKVRMFIPSWLGYGNAATSSANGAPSIPANSCLDYTIEITAVTN
ncbi:FKBP-type peptidyl-prolyl cis-trans isomerase [Pedobacter gandavensis]|uniref:Peptidyl-prolyl cis-trans isomerase n=1 Tax=Pedobacter gandavensis TaxID=2679963 RepID=A0ABR6EWU4_9SPHI|nr:FKBP-type peptidyl-prolyl cis-trans isomerase [Pedobacter gandavensis]MBB2149747.1 hypothetical protein [Pedobacter gandavensis]